MGAISDAALEGRVAVVTGATGSLGRAVADSLAAAGAAVGLVARSVDRPEAAPAELRAGGSDAQAFTADVLDVERLESVRDEVLERWGRIDILVNAAGGDVGAATAGGESVF